jgi:dihydropteroate synthase
MLVDPGLGFAKEAAHSFEVLSRLHQFAELGRPIVIGPSRKTFLARTLPRREGDPVSRDWATAAAITAAVLCGAHIVRVHAVKELAEVVRVADEIRKYHRDV